MEKYLSFSSRGIAGLLSLWACVAVVDPAIAATVRFTARPLTTAEQIETGGSLLWAVNNGAGAGTNVTVKGVVFAGGRALYPPARTVAAYAADVYDSVNNSITGISPANGDLLFDYFEYSSSANAGSEVLFTNLVLGTRYLFQMILVDDRLGVVNWTAMIGSGAYDGVVELSVDFTQDTPQLVTGSFVADDTNQVFWIKNSNNNLGSFNAFQLRAVPTNGVTFTLAPFTDVLQIDPRGDLILAVNAGSASDVTVNGVTFSGGRAVYDLELKVADDVSIYDSVNNSIQGLSTIDADALLDSASQGSAPKNVEITFSGLQVGSKYYAQFLCVDDRPAAAGRLLRVGAGADFEGGYALENIDLTQDVPQLIRAEFVASSTSQTLSLGLHGPVTGYGAVNAVQLRKIHVESGILIEVQ